MWSSLSFLIVCLQLNGVEKKQKVARREPVAREQDNLVRDDLVLFLVPIAVVKNNVATSPLAVRFLKRNSSWGWPPWMDRWQVC
jgi:hypothetical protein